MDQQFILHQLTRIANALERLSPPPLSNVQLDVADAFLWQTNPDSLTPVDRVHHVDLSLLKGIQHQADILLRNTQNFAAGRPANNALLWGARGTGKSSLVKAVHGQINARTPHALVLVEIHREDLPSLPRLLRVLKTGQRRFMLFCDDLSFEGQDEAYKSLKAVLDGGIEGRPDNVLFYATSNRRHLMARQMIENEQSTAINPSEAVEEKVSLSDRFGLWLGFHNVGQDVFFQMLEAYRDYYRLPISNEDLHRHGIEWSMSRGSRSGRVAWQMIQDLMGKV